MMGRNISSAITIWWMEPALHSACCIFISPFRDSSKSKAHLSWMWSGNWSICYITVDIVQYCNISQPIFSLACIYWELENLLRSHESFWTNKGKKWVTYQINFICLHSASRYVTILHKLLQFAVHFCLYGRKPNFKLRSVSSEIPALNKCP